MYTHYYYRNRTVYTQEWAQLTQSVKCIVENMPEYSLTAGGYFADVPLDIRLDYEDDSPPAIDDKIIRFVGSYGHACQPFRLQVEGDIHDSVEWCQTARLPYDFVVCSALILLNHFAPEAFNIYSDGNATEWLQALEHCQQILGIPGLTLPPSIDGQQIFIVKPWYDHAERVWF